MANVIISGDATQLNDIFNELFIAAIVKQPVIRYMTFGSPMFGSQSEFKWSEEAREEVTGTLNGDFVAATGDIILTAGTFGNFQVGDQVKIDGHVDTNNVQIIYRVDTLASPNLEVTAVNGTSTNLTSTGQTVFINRSQIDGYTPANFLGVDEPDLISSYFQLFDDTVRLGYKAISEAQGGAMQGIDDAVKRAFDQAAQRMAWKLYRAFMWSFGVKETASVAAKTQGLVSFINTSSDVNRIDASAATITEDMINDLVEKLVLRGMPDDARKVLVTSIQNARVIAGLRQDKVQYITNEPIFGQQAITTYTTEIQGVGAVEVISDTNAPNEMVMLVTPSVCQIIPRAGIPGAGQLAAVTEMDATAQYARRWIMRSDIGLMCQYATRYHGIIYDLA